MRKINALAAVSVVGLLVLGACGNAGGSESSMDSSGSSATSSASAMEKDSMEKDAMDKDAMEKDAMDKDSMEKDSMEKKDAMSAAGRFLSYEDYSSAMMKDGSHEGTTVLFFNASWCPDCQAIKKALQEDSSLLPAGVDVVDVDYDSHTDLRQKYGVTMQHTFVQVDASGKEVTSWSSSSVEDLTKHLGSLDG